MAESKSSLCDQNNKLDDNCQNQIQPAKEYKPEYSPGGRKTRCCPTTKRKGAGGFMNMFCKALGCCGLLSACYEPKTCQTRG